jgi:hypothetical protein
MKPRIMIDLDGVVHRYSKGFHDGSLYDGPMPGAKEFIDSLKDVYEIVIFTARVSTTKDRFAPASNIKYVEKWLNKHNIYFDIVTSDKLPAIAYVDDRAIEFKGDWKYVRERFEILDKDAKDEFNISCWKKDIDKIMDKFDDK